MNLPPVLSRNRFLLIAGTLLLAAGAMAAARGFVAWRTRAELREATRMERAMVLHEDFEGALAEGEKALSRFPEARELRAWYILALVREAKFDEAKRLAREMTAKHPEDPWSWFSVAATVGDEALAAADKALALAPRHPDFLWMKTWTMMHTEDDQVMAIPGFVDRHLREVPNPAELLVAKAEALEFLGTQIRGDDPERVSLAYAALEEARRIDPEDFRAHYLAGIYLYRSGEPEKALPLLLKAVALAPDSTRAHREYWRAFNALDPSLKTERREAVEKDVESLLAKSAGRPWALAQVADQYGALGLPDRQREIEERVLREFPGTDGEEWVVYSRVDRLARALDLWSPKKRKPPGAVPEMGPVPGDIEPVDRVVEREMTSGFQQLLWKFLEKPHSDDGFSQGYLYGTLFQLARLDPAYDGKKLEKIVRGMAANVRYPDPALLASGLSELANRGIVLDEAEQMARTAVARMEHTAGKEEGPAGGIEDPRKELVANLHDALGWILFQRGRAGQADEELRLAERMRPGARENLYHRGEVARAQGDLRGAEALFAECALLPPQGDNPCKGAIQDLYLQKHGSLEGFDKHFSEVAGQGRSLRKARLLSARIRPPAAIPPFDLTALDGTRFSLESLRGKVTVIDFWGLWCGACIAAFPEFQRLAATYARDSEVLFLSVNSGDSRPTIEKWLRKNPTSLPILMDNGFVDQAKIEYFPTVWFLDPQGRLSSVLVGNEEALVEEAGWLIEDLKRR